VAAILEGQFDDEALASSLRGRITTPTLIIHGELEDPDGGAARAAAEMADARVVALPALGHIGAWPEAPDASVSHVLTFLRDEARAI
jgi:pimeloyl-ACP methyl ester carboxylesterase